MDSMKALKTVVEKIKGMGYKVINLDTIVVCAAVRLSPFREKMLENIKKVLECDAAVKFKSGNGVGDAGKGKAIEAYATILVSKY